MSKTNVDKFKLSKVKLISGGGLSCKYSADVVEDDGTYTRNFTVDATDEIHPDLAKLFVSLKPVFARIFHLDHFRRVIQEEEFEATSEQSAFAEAGYQSILGLIDITGISIKGSDNTAGVVVTGTFKADTNQKMALNTHFIKFNETKYGFEEDLEVTVDEIKDETYKFLFENKHAQLDLFADANEDEEEEYDEDDSESED